MPLRFGEDVLCVLLHAAQRTKTEYETAIADLDNPDAPFDAAFYRERWTNNREIAHTLEAIFDTALDYLNESAITPILYRHIGELALDEHMAQAYPCLRALIPESPPDMVE